MPAMLRDRGIQYGIAGSALWHLFWLFVVTVNFSNGGSSQPRGTRIYFLGPVLSDRSFNTIVASKPELSETIYRSAGETAEALEPEIESLGRESPGDAVSVPSGQAAWSSLRGVLNTSRVHHPALFYEKFPVDIVKSPFPVTGQLAKRDIFYLPPAPPEPVNAPAGAPSEAVFEIAVNAAGAVVRVENEISSGDPETDLSWQRYLKEWQFMPNQTQGPAPETGEIRLRFPDERARP